MAWRPPEYQAMVEDDGYETVKALIGCRRAYHVGEVHGESDLSSDAGTGDVPAAQDAEREAQAGAHGALAAKQNLKLTSAEIAVNVVAAVDFRAERQARAEVVQNREATGKDVAARRCDAHHDDARPRLYRWPLDSD